MAGGDEDKEGDGAIYSFMQADRVRPGGDGLEIEGADLAEFLRSGPARPMVDRLVREAAEAAGVEFMSLGIRDDMTYYFIATHGFPFTSYATSVPAGRLKPKLFAAPVEVEDLQVEKNFSTLASVPVAKYWRYGVNVPVRLQTPLADHGVLALSGADRQPRKVGGKTLEKLKKVGEILSDSVWLMMQLKMSAIRHQDHSAAARVLLDGLRHTQAPIALVDDHGRITEFSPGFAMLQGRLLGEKAEAGQRIAGRWLDDAAQSIVARAFHQGGLITSAETRPAALNLPLSYDFHVLKFPEAELRLGVFSINLECAAQFLDIGNRLGEPGASTYETQGQNRGQTRVLPSLDEPRGPLQQFLRETLLHRPRLLHRNRIGYIAISKWRSAIKAHQIAALKALKAEIPPSLPVQLAEDMVMALRSVHGAAPAGSIVPVPCGHSGPGCLSCRMAEALAERLGVPCVQAFGPLAVAGQSHPRKNARRPAMQRVADLPPGPVILVDDVASSGSHIEEAATKLLEAASAVWPIVWIGS